jgi:tetratricopeptide (TPR) repeat protein
MNNQMNEILSKLLALDSAEALDDKFRPIDFDELFTQSIHSKFNINTNMGIEYLWSLYSKGFEAVKALNFTLAEYYFNKADKLVEKESLEPDVKKYLNIYTTPKKAYYWYKKKDFAEAFNLTWDALLQVEAIEEEFPNMHMGKIQQLHNIARMLFRQNKFDEALQVTHEILKYLMLGQQPQVEKGRWSKLYKERCDPTLVSLMTMQVFSEDVLNMLLIADIDKRQAFVTYFEALKDFVPFFTQDSAYVNWINAISAYYRFNYEEFFQYSALLFKGVKNKFITLKTFILVLCIEQLSERELNKNIEEATIKYLDISLNAPAIIKKIVNSAIDAAKKINKTTAQVYSAT